MSRRTAHIAFAALTGCLLCSCIRKTDSLHDRTAIAAAPVQSAAPAAAGTSAAVTSVTAATPSLAIPETDGRYNRLPLSVRLTADSLFLAKHTPADQPGLSRYHAARLEVLPGAVDSAVQLRIEPLGKADLPPLDPGLVNVTTLEGGFRFLPRGTQFAQPTRIAMTLDSTLIPKGYTKDDIRAFYFDEALEQWIALAADPSFAPEEGWTGSCTTHFTDMINGILKVPETPATASYTPTAISELKAADPSAGITLIAPPQAVSSGAATLQYPLRLPAGRAGMTPGLVLAYSSEGGNGWLGQGWSIQTPAISVESRWGVPRYLPDRESETYLADGQQLSPVAHRADYEARSGEKQFYPRVEGAFSRIIRHGASPKDYWWEVTATDGSRSFYGGRPESGMMPSATLADGEGNIGQWSLTEVRDLNDNRIRYFYGKTAEPFLTTGEEVQQMVLQRVEYAAHGSGAAPHTVEFTVRDGRPDVTVSARQGFLQREALLLDEIRVSTLGKPLRAYRMSYSAGAFGKTLLTGVETLDSEGRHFYSHSFAYHNDLGDDLYGPETAYTPPDEGQGAGFVNPINAFSDRFSSISGSKSWGATAGVAVTFGLSFGPGKFLKVGGNYSYTHSETEGMVTMVDLNGDGIPDKVYKKSGGLYYRPGSTDSERFFGEEVRLAGAPSNFMRSKSNTNSAGLEANAFVVLARITGWTKTSTDIYIADYNGDGLPDIAHKGVVYFNRLTGGHPSFEAVSSGTWNPIQASGVIDPSLLPDAAAETAEQQEANPLHNSVRVWRAPYRGTVKVDAPVTLVAATDPTVEGYDTRDGIRAAVELRNSVLWSAAVGADDLSPQYCNLSGVAVSAGDLLCFRLQSVENGACDRVYWSPVIEYTAITDPAIPPWLSEPNGKAYSRYDASADFVPGGDMPLSLPRDGTVEVRIPFGKPHTTDSLWLRVYYTADTISPAVLQYEQAMAPADTLHTDFVFSMDVKKESLLEFQLRSATNIAWERIDCRPVVTYTALAGGDPVTGDDGLPLYRYPAVTGYRIYDRHLRYRPPYAVDTALTIRLLPLLQVADTTRATGSLTFSVKGVDSLYARKTCTTDRQSLRREGAYLRPSELDTLTLHPAKGDVLYMEYHADSLDYAENTVRTACTLWVMNGDGTVRDSLTLDAGLYACGDRPWYGYLYRGWGQFAYNGQAVHSAAPMDFAAIEQDIRKLEDNPDIDVSDPGALTDDQLEELRQRMYDPATARYLLMMPDAAGRYAGYDAAVYVDGSSQGSSRLGMNDVVVQPFDVGAGQFPTIAQGSSAKNVTKNIGISAGVVSGARTTSESETTRITELLDLNGDGYPDLMNGSGVQYTGPLGGLHGSIAHTIPDLVSTARAEGISIGGGGLPAKSGNSEGKQSGIKPSKSSQAMMQAMSVVSLSGSLGSSEDRAEAQWVDVNGDGLPDRAFADGTVSLNLGYRFAQPCAWATTLNSGMTADYGAGLGVSMFGNSFASGVSLSRSENGGSTAMIDINGDGLPDMVTANSVRFNTGTDYSAPQTVSHNPMQQGVGTGEAVNASATISIPIPILSWLAIAVSPQAAAQHGASRERATMADMNGDGIPDGVYSDREGELRVRYARTGRINLLESVRQPLGSSMTLDYAQTAPSTDDPHVRWTMASLEVDDGLPGDGADVQRLTFAYENPVYERFERTPLGFATVTATQHDTENGGLPYRRTVQRYYNDNIYRQGLLREETALTAAGDTLGRTVNAYRTLNPATMAPASYTRFFSGRLWTAPAQVTEYLYEEGGRLAMEKQFAHDAWGNVERYVETPGDDPAGQITVTAAYRHDHSRYLHSLPESVEVASRGEGTLRRRRAGYDERGNMTQLAQAIDAGGAEAVTDFTYDALGNITGVTRPANYKGQRLRYAFTYDGALHTLVTGVEDSYGYGSSTEYDYRWAAPLKSTDMNGTVMEYGYDARGRQTSAGMNGSTLLTFEYHPEAAAAYARTTHHTEEGGIDTYTFTDGLARPVQVKKTGAVSAGGAAVQQVMIVSGKTVYDAFGRATATGQPVTEPPGSEAALNADPLLNPTTVIYDPKDRPLVQTLPDGGATSLIYAITPEGILRQATDPLGHVAEAYSNLRGHLLQTVRRSAGGDVRVRFARNALDELLQVTDPAGNISRVTYDMLGRTLSTQHPDAGLTTMTCDAAGNLLKKVTGELAQTLGDGGGITYTYEYERPFEVIYPRNIHNRVTYAWGAPGATNGRAGRLALVQDASGGQEFFYDAAGNVSKTIRSVIASKNEVLTYVYGAAYDPWGRVRELTYPDGEKVTYAYDAAGQLASFRGMKDGREYRYLENQTYDRFGHTVYRQTGNGARHEYTYEPKRQRLQEMKLFAGDSLLMHNIYTFDAVDNILSIVNDTQSRHAYSYDDLNRLVSAAGRAGDASYTLGMEYDIMGNPTGKKQMTQGSQAGSHEWAYAYNGPKPNAAMQIGSRRYTYDGNGNPASWEDSASYHLMAWDEENRLTALDDNAYISRYVYDHSGERVVKTHGGSSGISINGIPQGTLSHNENTTLYVSPYFTVGKNGAEFTKHYYAGSQRLVSKLGNGRFNNHFRPGVYGLTAGGVNYIERMQSITQSREEYIRNLGIAPGPPHMKGIYADPAYSGVSYPDGGTPSNTYVPAGWPRKVIPLQDKDPNGPPGAPIQYYPPMSNETAEPGFAYEGAGQIEESGRYFYHGDHLGSTSYVTDARGRVSQYVAYMPYGEALFEEHSNTRDMPYLFNSKERDEETGLYYYGARYLDPETAVWYGVDLLAMEHPDYSPYIYCTNNPLKYIDPDGRDPIYAKNFWGKVRMIGDDGQSSTGSYLVRGSVARDVKSATKAGEFYTGSLVESKNIVHVPTGQKLEGVKQSFEDTKLSQRENGGHSNIGDANVTRWDEGPTAVAFTDKDGNRGAEATLQMFVVNGQNTMPADASNVEMWWHTHPNTTVNGVSLGNSNPSDADYSGQKIMTKKGYKGNTFVIGVRSGTVTFFNKDGALQTVKWSDFLRMGGQEK